MYYNEWYGKDLAIIDKLEASLEREMDKIAMESATMEWEPATEGVVGDILSLIAGIFKAIPNAIRGLLSNIHDSTSSASARANNKDNVPEAITSLPEAKKSKILNYRARIESERSKLARATLNVVRDAIDSCDTLNGYISKVLNEASNKGDADLKSVSSFSEEKLTNIKNKVSKSKNDVNGLNDQAQDVNKLIDELKSFCSDDNLFGFAVPDYVDDKMEESTNELLKNLASKSKKYLDDTNGLISRFEKKTFRKDGKAISHGDLTNTAAYKLLGLYKECSNVSTDIVKTYTNVAKVLYAKMATSTDSTPPADKDDPDVTGHLIYNKQAGCWYYTAYVLTKKGNVEEQSLKINSAKDANKRPYKDKRFDQAILDQWNKSHDEDEKAVQVGGDKNSLGKKKKNNPQPANQDNNNTQQNTDNNGNNGGQQQQPANQNNNNTQQNNGNNQPAQNNNGSQQQPQQANPAPSNNGGNGNNQQQNPAPNNGGNNPQQPAQNNNNGNNATKQKIAAIDQAAKMNDHFKDKLRKLTSAISNLDENNPTEKSEKQRRILMYVPGYFQKYSHIWENKLVQEFQDKLLKLGFKAERIQDAVKKKVKMKAFVKDASNLDTSKFKAFEAFVDTEITEREEYEMAMEYLDRYRKSDAYDKAEKEYEEEMMNMAAVVESLLDDDNMTELYMAGIYDDSVLESSKMKPDDPDRWDNFLT